MKKRLADRFLFFVLILLAVSCASVAIGAFSLEYAENQSVNKSVIGIVKGSALYGRGFYLPTDSSTLDVSLIMYHEGTETEISHQRIRNIQKFPFQYSIRFDEAELIADASYRVVLSFTNDGTTFYSAQSSLTDNYPPDNTSLTLL